MAFTLYICPKCSTSIIDAGVERLIEPLLKMHQKTCGGTPARVARVKLKTETGLPPLQGPELVEGLTDRAIKAAAEMLKKGVSDAVKRKVGKRR